MYKSSHMKRRQDREHQRILSTPRGVILLNVNVTEGKAVDDQQFLQETMFADRLSLDEKAKQEKKLKEKYEQWFEEPEGEPSY